jgi:hypothetical protein
VPGLPSLAKAFSPIGISARTAVILLLSGYAGGLLSLALGFHSRLSAFLAWGLHLSFMTSGFASFYGVDQLANTFLFYLFLFPSGRAWAFASRPTSSRREETVPVGCLRVMQLHLCAIYLGAGVHKAMGRQWWNGEAIWQVVSQPDFSTFDLSWLARHPWIPRFAGWGTLLVEVGYVFLIWPRRTRKAWCIATIGLHLGMALFMGLVFFSSLMILLTGCLFLIPEEVPHEAATAIPGGARRGRLAAARARG